MKNLGAIILFLSGNFISSAAQGISTIAVPVYFINQGLSSTYATVYLVVTLVSLFWSPLAGSLIDKYDRRKLFLALNLICGLLLATITGLSYFIPSLLPLWAAFAFALTFWNFSIHYPGAYALMQEITEPKHYSRIASIMEVQNQLAYGLSAAGAAILIGGLEYGWITIEPWEIYQILALDTSTYFAAFLLIAFVRYVPIAQRHPEKGSTLKRLKVGYDYLKNHPYLFLFGLASFSVFMVVLLHIYILSPVYVEKHLQAPGSVFAWSELMYSIGALIAGIITQYVFKRLSFVSSIIIMILTTIGLFTALIFSVSIPLFYMMTCLLGLTNAGIRVLRISYFFQVIPNQVMGRTNSIFNVCNILARVSLLGIFALPFFHTSNNVIYAFAILNGIMLLSAIVLMVYYPKLVLRKETQTITN